MQDAAIQIGCSLPYRAACQQLRKLSGALISPEEMRLLTNAYGKQRAECQQQEAERRCSTAAAEPASEATTVVTESTSEATVVTAEPASEATAATTEPPLLVGMDGGWICSREQRGGWKEKSRWCVEKWKICP